MKRLLALGLLAGCAANPVPSAPMEGASSSRFPAPAPLEGEDALPTKATLSVIDTNGMRALSTEPFLPGSTLLHDGFVYGIRADGAQAFVRFRRRLDGAGVGAEQVIAKIDQATGSFDIPVFDACSVMWRSQDGLERIALPRP